MSIVNTIADAPSEAALLAHIRKAQHVSGLGGGREDAHVYFIQRGGDGGPVKIGASTNVVRRLAELQIAAPETMRLVGVFILGGHSMEARLHRFHATDRISGEWFAPTPAVWETIQGFGWPQ